MQIHKEFRGILGIFTAKNTAEFRGIPFVFQKIPYSVGSQKRTSVDTLVALPSFFPVRERGDGKRGGER